MRQLYDLYPMSRIHPLRPLRPLRPLVRRAGLVLAVMVTASVARAGRGEAVAFQQKLDVGPVAVQVDLPSTVYSLADPIELSVTLSAPPHIRIEGPGLSSTSPAFTIIETHTDGPDTIGRFALRRWRARIEPLRLGELALPPAKLRYQSGSDPWEEGSIPLPTLRIVPGPTSSADPKSLRPIPTIPDAPGSAEPTSRARLATLLRWAGLGLAGAAIALLLLARRRAPGLSPRDRTLADLARLESALETGQTDPRAAIAVSGERVRLYLQEAHGLAAPKQSTPEFLADPATHARLTDGQRAALDEYLIASDARTFASPEPTADQAALCLRRARAFLAGESGS